jgi:hypothetical protein
MALITSNAVDIVNPIILKGSAINQIMGNRKINRIAIGQQTTSKTNQRRTAIIKRTGYLVN